MVGSHGACTHIPSFLDGLACVPQQWSELKRENITLCLQEMRKLRIQQLAGPDQARRVTAGPRVQPKLPRSAEGQTRTA